MHGFEKNRLKGNLVGFILILYFDEDHRSFMIIFGFWKNIGSLYIFIFLQVILYFGFDHRAVVMLPDFR